MYFMRPLFDYLGLMGNAVELPFLSARGLNTDIMFGVSPIDTDECGELNAGQNVFMPSLRSVRLSPGTCLPEFCEINMAAGAAACPEYSLTNSSAPAGSKPNRVNISCLSMIFVTRWCMSRSR